MFLKKKLRPYEVTVHLNGRHPYLKGNELDFKTRDVKLIVPAKDFNHAETQGLMAVDGMQYWSASVKAIART